VKCVRYAHALRENFYDMQKSTIIELSKLFAVDIINICREIRENRNEKVLVNQLLRSGTSIGANAHEANYASSRLDFINKMQIALKECYETEYWLDIFRETAYITQEEYDSLSQKCSKIRIKLAASIKTAKKNV